MFKSYDRAAEYKMVHPTTGVEDTLGIMRIYFTPGSYAYSGEGLKLLQLVEGFMITVKTVEDLCYRESFPNRWL